MQIRTTTNAQQLGRFMSGFFNDQVAFALQQAVRRVALEAQVKQREHNEQIFRIRRRTFIHRAVKIRDWPTKQDPTAIIRIEPPGGTERMGIITDHEEGGTRRPQPGHRGRLVEREVRPSPQRIAPKKLRPKQLKLRKRSDGGEKGFEVWQGQHRTFMIRRPGGEGAIFQRHAKGKKGTFQGTKVLWAITPDGVRLLPTLAFHDNAQKLVSDRWIEIMAKEWDRAILSAR